MKSLTVAGWSRGVLVAALVVVLVLAACDTTPAPVRTLLKPAPVDSSVMLYAYDLTGQLLAYAGRDGTLRWTYAPPVPYIKDSSAPVYDNGLVIGFTWSSLQADHMTLTAIRASDGHPVWTLRTPFYPTPAFAVSGSLVVVQVPATPPATSSLLVVRAADGVLLHTIAPAGGPGFVAMDDAAVYRCTQDGHIAAYALSDGRALWRFTYAAPDSHAALVGCDPFAAGGKVLLDSNGTVMALDARNGHVVWQRAIAGFVQAVCGSTVFVAVDLAPQATGGVSPYALAVLRTTDGSSLWQAPGTRNLVPNIADVSGVVIYAQGGGLQAIRATDGSALWQRHPSNRVVHPVGATGQVLYATDQYNFIPRQPVPDGTDVNAYLVAMDASDASLLWRAPVGTQVGPYTAAPHFTLGAPPVCPDGRESLA